MPVTQNDLVPRIGHRVRVRIAYPGNTVIPFVEYDALLAWIDIPNQFAHITIGVPTVKVRWQDIDFLEGGIGPPLDEGTSKGTGLGTDNG